MDMHTTASTGGQQCGCQDTAYEGLSATESHLINIQLVP